MHCRLSAVLVGTCLLLVLPAGAQDNQSTQVLPDIAPRVVEIRGNLEISLPSLQRQPLIGFNPPPRVAPIPPDRLPYVEEYKQESVDLPPSPLNPPAPPAVASLIGGAPLNGMIEGTIGRYLSRSVRFRSEWALSDAAAVYSRLDYAGSRGHEPDEAVDAVTASYDALDALVGVQNVTPWAAIGLEIDGFLNNYDLYGTYIAAVGDVIPTRDGRGGGARLWMNTQASTAVDLDVSVRYGVASYEVDALANGEMINPEAHQRDEASLDAASRVDLPLSDRHNLVGDLHFTGLGFDEETVGSDVRMVDAAGGLKLSANRRFELTGLGRVMGFSQSDSASGFYVSPDVRLDVYPIQGLRLYVQNDARSDHRSTALMYRESPYLVNRPVVQPTIYTVDARAGSRLQLGIFEADIHGGYSRAPNFQYFERAVETMSGGTFDVGLVDARYEEATIRYVGGDVSVNLPAGFNMTTGLTFRDGRLTDVEEEIPYFGPVVGRGALSYSFLAGRGYLQAVMTYESARYVNLDRSRKLGDYFDLDIDASYQFADGVGVLLRLENLSAGYLERWEHYDQPPFVVSAGLRAQW